MLPVPFFNGESMKKLYRAMIDIPELHVLKMGEIELDPAKDDARYDLLEEIRTIKPEKKAPKKVAKKAE